MQNYSPTRGRPYSSTEPYGAHDYSDLVSPGPKINQPPTKHYTQPQTKPKRKKPILPILVIIFSLITLLLILGSFFSTWYTFTKSVSTYGVGVDFDTEFSFSGIKNREKTMAIGITTSSYSWEEAQELDMDVEDAKNLYSIAQILVAISFIMCILMLIGAILLFLGGLKIISVVFSVLTLIFCLITPVYFMLAHQDTMGFMKEEEFSFYGLGLDTDFKDGPWNSFWGSEGEKGDENGIYSDPDFTASWGPSNGWYLCWLGLIFAMITFILIWFTKVPLMEKPKFTPKPTSNNYRYYYGSQNYTTQNYGTQNTTQEQSSQPKPPQY